MNISSLLKGKKIGLIGMGKSNVSLGNYLLKYTSEIFITEILPETEVIENLKLLNPKIKYECGKHSDEIFSCDIVIKSPGIPEHLDLVKKIYSKNIPIFTELEISYQLILEKLSFRPKIIAITGTNGKTTTTTLIYEIVSGYFSLNPTEGNAVLCGNIGTPIIEFVDKIQKDTVVVVEVSSYQLENIVEFRPFISCILNITEDHLDHHLTMENYIHAKGRIFMNQTEEDFVILNFDDENIRKTQLSKNRAQIVYFSRQCQLEEGCYLYPKDKSIIFSWKNKNIKFTPTIKLPGGHNVENILCAISSCTLLGVPKDIIEKKISEFRGVEHRLELVRELNGVVYINDSKSTNVNSTLVALKSFDGPIHLILGGRDKGAPYTPLISLIKSKVKSIYLIGEATEIIYSQLKDCGIRIYKCGDLENAIKKIQENVTKGDIVLFSPACSSFDQYKNFEHRGREFKRLVLKI